MRAVPDHWITGNDGSQVPRRFVFLDTEAVSERTDSGERQSWRCAVANYVHWTSSGRCVQDYREYDNAATLHTELGDFTRSGSRTVVYCHNLPYDMRIAGLLIGLPATGWHLDQIRLDSRGSWSRWVRSKATLLLCDTASIFPCTVATLGKLCGRLKTPLPTTDAIEDWLAHCRRDVEIISTVTLEYLTWLRAGNAGNWQMTGSSQSWSHWRHCFYSDKVLIHHDEDARAAERRALWTGRAENWRWGRNATEPLYEWDYANAYPRVAKDCDVPTRYLGTVAGSARRDLSRLWTRYRVLARVRVRTDQPIVPAEHAGGIVWPVGEFETTLWDPELRLLSESGCDVQVVRAFVYERKPALRSWAEWVMNGIHSEDVRQARWLPIVLKHWSRSLIGRFSMRYQKWDHFGTFPDEDIRIGTRVDRDTGMVADTLRMGRDLYTLSDMEEAPHSCPQITGYVMSEQRAKMWCLATMIGRENVFYMDTDSLIVNATGHVSLSGDTKSPLLDGLRLKSRSRGYEIYGPRSLTISGQEKYAGLPRNSTRISEHEFLGEVWTSLEHSVRKGEFDNVTITNRPYSIRWNDRRRERLADGTTAPWRLPATGHAAGHAGEQVSSAVEHAAGVLAVIGARQLPA